MGLASVLGKVADYTPGVSNIKGAVQGDWAQAAGGAGTELYRTAKGEATGGALPQQPGVGGAAAPGSHLVQDPQTGLFYNPATGTTYSDPSGQVPVTNPNVSQQVAQNFARSQDFLTKLDASRQQQQQVFGQQTGLAASLNNTINNVNAPSVAQQQLGIGLDAGMRQQLAGAAGATGGNAFAAQRNAANNIGQLAGQENQSAGLARAQEVGGAQGRLADVLNNQGAGARAMYNADGSLASTFSGQALSGQTSNQGLNQKADETNKKANGEFFHDVVGAGASLAGGA